MRKNDDDDLVWQIGSIEQTGSVQHVKGRLSVNVAWILGACAALALALIGFWVYRFWAAQTAQAEIRAVVVGEDEAARQRDAAGLLALSETDAPGWVAWQQALAATGAPVPRPDPGLTPSTAEPELAFVDLGDAVARVQVTRTFNDVDGNAYRFSYDQFYRRTDDAWRRTPPPADYWGATETFWGAHVGITYTQPDKALIVDDIGPSVEKMLVRLCSTQPCIQEMFPVHLELRSAYTAILAVDPPVNGVFLSPRLAGVPADSGALDRYRLNLKGWTYWTVATAMYQNGSGDYDEERITRIGVCVGALPGKRDLKACVAEGIP